MKIYFFILLLFIVGIDQSFQDKCHSDNLQSCFHILTTYAKENENPFPLDEAGMKIQCSYMDEMRNCVYNYSRVCMTELERSLGELLFAGTVQSMKDMCDPSNKMYQDFIKHAKCVNEKYGGTSPCFRDAFAAIEALESTESTDRVHFLCCGINRFRKCIANHLETACSKDLVDFIDSILEFVATEFALQVCTSYETHKNGCPKLPTGDQVKGTYKTNLLGEFLSPFYKE